MSLTFPIMVRPDPRKGGENGDELTHPGPILAYISPDPPTENSFVKIFEKGLYELPEKEFAPGKWAISTELKSGFGIMNVRVPAGLKAGPYVVPFHKKFWILR